MEPVLQCSWTLQSGNVALARSNPGAAAAELDEHGSQQASAIFVPPEDGQSACDLHLLIDGRVSRAVAVYSSERTRTLHSMQCCT
jgi:hypothetical protein